ncbi:MAG: FAD-dependent oxidoreductase [Chitinophagaceae bacterium]|nr:FAD-dependent oxidoreductase [Chitinophagaceae bacterium]
MKAIAIYPLCKLVFIACILTCYHSFSQTNERNADICVYGATSAGVIAAYTAKQAGRSVILIDPGKHVGGLTSGGLGYTDIGNKFVISGIARDFYRRIGKHYGRLEQWIFEPHVAEQTFMQYLDEAGIKVVFDHYLVHAQNESSRITGIRLRNTQTSEEFVVTAKMFIDCSYEGDLMAKAGVSYIVGREANSTYNETYNGVQLREKHQFPDGVDPYRIPGKPESGLLWGISNEVLAEQGSGDQKVQAYNFRICLSDDPSNSVPVTQPDDYDAARYELLLRVIEKNTSLPLDAYLKIDHMPNRKTDINNNGAFSTDMIGMNYQYPEADHAARQRIIKTHADYVKGLLYFMGNDNRVPEHLRKEMLRWGYPKDEYTDNDYWSPQMYVREARRMKGAYVMTQANCEGKETVTDAVGMAAYTMDSHNCQRIVVNGMVKNEGDVQIGGFGPYPISYKSLVPKAEECKNLLVPVCLSASHIAYGSIRMEPVFMVLAQSAALAAVEAIKTKRAVQDISIAKVQKRMQEDPLMDGSAPEILVDNDDQAHVTKKGNWSRVTRGAYGNSMFVSDESGASVRFLPGIAVAGKYHLYFYLPKIENASRELQVKVFDGKDERTITISPADMKVEGQTSGEWVDMGMYTLAGKKPPYVEVSRANATGSIVADAVLFIKEKE